MTLSIKKENLRQCLVFCPPDGYKKKSAQVKAEFGIPKCSGGNKLREKNGLNQCILSENIKCSSFS